MFLWLYNLCFPVVFLALLPGYLGRMLRRGDYRAQFGQRLGWYSAEVRARLHRGAPRIWVQAVSVGEMLIAFKFITALREQAPGLPLILSTTTTTAFRLARERVGADVEVMYSPIDLLPIVRRAFRVLRPAAVVIVDGGLWPNQLSEAHRRHISTALVNARLSPRSERRFRQFPTLSATIFRLLDLVCVSELSDVERWSLLSIAHERIQHTGSIKYDDQSSPPAAAKQTASGNEHTAAAWQTLLSAIGVFPHRPVLLAGSTHAGEEMILAQTYLALRRTFPDLFLIIAPRHVERTADVLGELSPLGLNILRRTALAKTAESLRPDSRPGLPDVLLLDTTGELGDWFAAATVVFIGKSLTAVGGHNPAEAIIAGKPVITGPHMENFQDLLDSLLAADAVIQIRDAAALQNACARLLGDAGLRDRMTAAGRQQLEVHRGASARSAALMLRLVKDSTC